MISFKKFKKTYTNHPKEYLNIVREYYRHVQNLKTFLKNIFPINIFNLLLIANILTSIWVFLCNNPIIFYTNLIYFHIGIIIFLGIIYLRYKYKNEKLPLVFIIIPFLFYIFIYVIDYIKKYKNLQTPDEISVDNIYLLILVYTIPIIVLILIYNPTKFVYYYTIYKLLKKDLSILQYPSHTVWDIYNKSYNDAFSISISDLHILHLFIPKNKCTYNRNKIYYKNKLITLV